MFFFYFRILQYSKVCDTVTEEKNKYVRLKEMASQTITELTEQIKVLENEMEIQLTIAVSKDRCVHEFELLSKSPCLDLCQFECSRDSSVIYSIFFFCILFYFQSRSLTKAQMKISNSSRMREKLRNDISKVCTHINAHNGEKLHCCKSASSVELLNRLNKYFDFSSSEQNKHLQRNRC